MEDWQKPKPIAASRMNSRCYLKTDLLKVTSHFKQVIGSQFFVLITSKISFNGKIAIKTQANKLD
jgi:hypothetical protein